MKRPLLHLGSGLQMRNLADRRLGTASYELKPGEADDPEAVQDLFRELTVTLSDTVGGYEGYLLLGAMLSYAVGPEFFTKLNWFSGVFLHGETGSGKSTLAGWLIRLWGFGAEICIKLPKPTTPVGLAIAAQQYCNLPLFFEEFKMTIEEDKVEWIKGLCRRELSSKMDWGEQRRQILTNALVAGESTSRDAAMHQRFVHVQVSASARRRLGPEVETQHFEWFMANSPFFFHLAVMCCGIAARSCRSFGRSGSGGTKSRR